MKQKMVGLVLTLLAGIAVGSAAQAAVVYDNTSTNQGFFGNFISSTAPATFLGGDEVTLGGTARIITAIDILLGANSPPATVDAQIKFFSNDGVDGAPGTLLWQSGLFDDFNLASDQTTLTASVPNVLVPDTFTWAVELSGWPANQIGAIGPMLYNPPTVGSSGDYYWYYNSSTTAWEKITYGDPVVTNFAARLTAVPEPATLALFGLGLAGIPLVRRRRTPA